MTKQRQQAIVRLILIIVALVNQTLTVAGYNPLPFSEDVLYETFTALFSGYAILVVWWKNNNVTPEAVQAQEELERLKALKEGE